jgi:hypothetical protein
MWIVTANYKSGVKKVLLQWLAHLSATEKVQLPGTKDLLILCMLDRCDYAFDREQGIRIDMNQIICSYTSLYMRI